MATVRKRNDDDKSISISARPVRVIKKEQK